MNAIFRLLLASMSFIAISSPAYAYIDPGTGTLIVQGLIGSLVAFTTFAGLYYQKVRTAIGRLVGKRSDDESEISK